MINSDNVCRAKNYAGIPADGSRDLHLSLLVFEVDLPAGNCSCSFALEICLELKELQHMEGWFMYHYTDLTEATEQNKDYCQWQQ